ncbi:putative ripening-related protein 7 [Sorghum bicolor]|nr:putative ripening-related protein 7 [Sorghum bicolor]EER91451.1 hypothetical protein SORBI_3001G210800 [Sorghum bicolor]|eukprot:XP_002464453.1 putative ripening-related protein 7 [Sorghum bicolor]
MAKAKPAAIAIVIILALLQVSWGTARKHKDDGGSGGTSAVMTVNGFQKGGTGGGPSECDGKYHDDDDLVVALSSQWYAGGKRCRNKISITSKDTGKTVEAKVVDECDSGRGCKDNIVDSSPAVWEKLGLDTSVGEVPVTWSDA